MASSKNVFLRQLCVSVYLAAKLKETFGHRPKMYEDDNAVIDGYLDDIQTTVDNVAEASNCYGLNISLKNTIASG